jgi:DNA polymerase-3 subunit epsilon
LDAVCNHYDIPLVHHRALPDAIACAELAITIFKERNVRVFNDIENQFNLRLGSLFKGGYKGSLKRSSVSGYKISDITYDPSKADENNIFYGRTVCFTGTLHSMVRVDAQRMVLEIGGNVSKGVTKETNYLVVGEQDYKQYGAGFKSSKMKKAEKYLLNGQEIELITENQFLEMMGN